MRKINGIILHWYGTGDYKNTVEQTREFHMKNRGYSDIGYHYVILHPDCPVFKNNPPKVWGDLIKVGRPIEKVGAHALGHNTGTMGVCVALVQGMKPHPLQLQAVRMGIPIWAIRHSIDLKSKIGLRGHGETFSTACPGPDLMKEVKALRGF